MSAGRSSDQKKQCAELLPVLLRLIDGPSPSPAGEVLMDVINCLQALDKDTPIEAIEHVDKPSADTNTRTTITYCRMLIAAVVRDLRGGSTSSSAPSTSRTAATSSTGERERRRSACNKQRSTTTSSSTSALSPPRLVIDTKDEEEQGEPFLQEVNESRKRLRAGRNAGPRPAMEKRIKQEEEEAPEETSEDDNSDWMTMTLRERLQNVASSSSSHFPVEDTVDEASSSQQQLVRSPPERSAPHAVLIVFALQDGVWRTHDEICDLLVERVSGMRSAKRGWRGQILNTLISTPCFSNDSGVWRVRPNYAKKVRELVEEWQKREASKANAEQGEKDSVKAKMRAQIERERAEDLAYSAKKESMRKKRKKKIVIRNRPKPMQFVRIVPDMVFSASSALSDAEDDEDDDVEDSDPPNLNDPTVVKQEDDEWEKRGMPPVLERQD